MTRESLPNPESSPALREDSGLQMRDIIRRRLALLMEIRMNFLRRQIPGGGSCLCDAPALATCWL